MNIKTVLEKALTERFSANLIIKGLVSIVEKETDSYIFEKYKNEIFNDGGNKYSLFGVFSRVHTYGDAMATSVTITLTFMSNSKLSKKHSEAMDAMKALYKAQKYLPYSGHKIPLWHQFRYELETNDVLGRNINLEINKK